LFGTPQQQQQQHQIPAQAAMHAHMEAMNRAETEKVKAELSKLYAIYTGTRTPSSRPALPASASSSDWEKKILNNNFATIVYNDLTQEHRQLQWLIGTTASGEIMPIAPPKPPQVSEEEWRKAVVTNPDPLNYTPIVLVGADSLNARVSWQQERAKQLAKAATSIEAGNNTSEQLFSEARRRLDDVKRAHANHRKRLLNVMRKVEVVRCMNLPLQPDEARAMQQLQTLESKVHEARHLLGELERRALLARPDRHHHLVNGNATPPSTSNYRHHNKNSTNSNEIDLPNRDVLAKVLQEHHKDLTMLSLTISQDARDADLLKQRVLSQMGPPPTIR